MQLKQPLTSENDLVVIRISDSSNAAELAKKAAETGRRYPDLPGAETIAQLAERPLRIPDIVDARLHSTAGLRAAYYRVPGTRTHVLLALGSATKADASRGDNAFVELLVDTLDQTRYESLWVADFARLLRSLDYLSHTWRAVHTRCRYVRHGQSVIDVTGETAEIQFMFEALSAAADAWATVRRTLNGKMRAYVEGRFPLPAAGIPIGFRPSRAIGCRDAPT